MLLLYTAISWVLYDSFFVTVFHAVRQSPTSTSFNGHSGKFSGKTEATERKTLPSTVFRAERVLNHDLFKKKRQMELWKCIKDCVPQITHGYRKSMFSYRTLLFHSLVRNLMCFMHPLTYNTAYSKTCILPLSIHLLDWLSSLRREWKNKNGENIDMRKHVAF